ncbi:migration and invasion inhibitory protein [Halichoeres trimaculatus]|uniref:migration and invasion inhibitory protein n=1 Tax=Halichoeres trimaculatus TaxID=147232 RepID=UPI003D9EABDD
MSFIDRLDALRKLNKDLLSQLKQQRENLERLSGLSPNRKREREDEAEERRDPAEVLTLGRGEQRTARAALTKPTVRFADECERQARDQNNSPVPFVASKHHRGTTGHVTPSDHFKESDRHPEADKRLQDSRPSTSKSRLESQSKEQEEQSRATSQTNENEEILDSDRHRLPPLLGYDWIAGVLDAEDSLIERSDEFFNDLCTFRSLNKEECVHSTQAEFSKENYPVLPLLTDKDDPREANTDTHQCTFSYRINSRLFPVPLHSEECCPVCKKHKSSHPHTTSEPALVRVSIPRSTLLPPHKYKAHRRCSFDSSDSLGLPSHCLAGWSNKGQSFQPPPSSLDLGSSLDKKSSTEYFSAPVDFCNKISGQISDVSRLPRHNFQHYSPKRKLRGTSCSAN